MACASTCRQTPTIAAGATSSAIPFLTSRLASAQQVRTCLLHMADSRFWQHDLLCSTVPDLQADVRRAGPCSSLIN